MNYTYKAAWENAKIFGFWLITLAGAIQTQIMSQIANSQLIHLKVMS